MAFLGVKGVLKMIVSHRAPSSLNMSSYGAIWTHFRPNSMICEKKCPGPAPGPGPGPGVGPGFGKGQGHYFFVKFMELGLKLAHMVRYELILRLDGALWLTIISKTP